jgi:hypothetical protein
MAEKKCPLPPNGIGRKDKAIVAFWNQAEEFKLSIVKRNTVRRSLSLLII